MRAIGVIGGAVGNTPAVMTTLSKAGLDARLVLDPTHLRRYDRLILPGVGDFGAFVSNLQALELFDGLQKIGQNHDAHILGICVGAQALFETSDEAPGVAGLSLIKGKVERLSRRETSLVPRVGWDLVSLPLPPESENIGVEPKRADSLFFFNHSFFMNPDDHSQVVAYSFSDSLVPAVVSAGTVIAAQFHPERSGGAGKTFFQYFSTGALDAT